MAPTSFDFIIVGGGLAGLVLATRLSEDGASTILVIEAGGDQTSDPRVTVPGLWPSLVQSESVWSFKTVPQQGLGGREVGFPQGRLLGGSSALNGLAFTATSKANVDAWERLGNPGWGWPSFSESMKKSYSCTLQGADTQGPVQLTLPEQDTEWPTVWKDTVTNLGFKTTSDPFNGEFLGALVVPDSVDSATKQRSYAASAYLEPARSRPNLTTWTKTQVEKIIFDIPDGVVATGVQVTVGGETKVIKARKEVIITAGAINSPKLLELSGIGDATLLESLGIDVVVDNPYVGENLQNHPMCTISFQVRDQPGFETMDKLVRQDPAALDAAMKAYVIQQKGPFSKSGGNLAAQLPLTGRASEDFISQLEALLPHCRSSEAESFSKLHETFVRTVIESPTEATGCYIAIPGFAGATSDGWMAPAPPGDESYFTLSVLLAHPLSRGSVHVTRSTEESPLAIDPRYLTHPLDIELMSRHLQLAEEMANSEPLKGHLKLNDRLFADLDAAKDHLRQNAIGAHHFTGTCSMMPKDLGGVVDDKLRVYGCRNLRVCDASIIPITPRTNPQATVYGVAEHAAMIIRGDIQVSSQVGRG